MSCIAILLCITIANADMATIVKPSKPIQDVLTSLQSNLFTKSTAKTTTYYIEGKINKTLITLPNKIQDIRKTKVVWKKVPRLVNVTNKGKKEQRLIYLKIRTLEPTNQWTYRDITQSEIDNKLNKQLEKLQ